MVPPIINVQEAEGIHADLRTLESEILDVIHDSVDDATFLRRDNLLASMTFSVDEVCVRLLDDVMSAGCRTESSSTCKPIYESTFNFHF